MVTTEDDDDDDNNENKVKKDKRNCWPETSQDSKMLDMSKL